MRYVINFVFVLQSSNSGVYFTLTAHLNLDHPHFKCSFATCVQWLPYWDRILSYKQSDAIQVTLASYFGMEKVWVKTGIPVRRLS